VVVPGDDGLRHLARDSIRVLGPRERVAAVVDDEHRAPNSGQLLLDVPARERAAGPELVPGADDRLPVVPVALTVFIVPLPPGRRPGCEQPFTEVVVDAEVPGDRRDARDEVGTVGGGEQRNGRAIAVADQVRGSRAPGEEQLGASSSASRSKRPASKTASRGDDPKPRRS